MSSSSQSFPAALAADPCYIDRLVQLKQIHDMRRRHAEQLKVAREKKMQLAAMQKVKKMKAHRLAHAYRVRLLRAEVAAAVSASVASMHQRRVGRPVGSKTAAIAAIAAATATAATAAAPTAANAEEATTTSAEAARLADTWIARAWDAEHGQFGLERDLDEEGEQPASTWFMELIAAAPNGADATTASPRRRSPRVVRRVPSRMLL